MNRSITFSVLMMCINYALFSQIVPDKIFFNGNIITMDPDFPLVTAIALNGDKILQVGADENILKISGPSTQQFDLDGITVLPGFVDAHNHLFNDIERNEESILASQELMFENGITTFGNLFSDEELIKVLQAMDDSGKLNIKTSIYLPAANNCGDVLGDWWMNFPPTREPGEKFRIGGVKLFTDGGTCDKLPALSWTYQHVDSQGDLFFDQEALNKLVFQADQAGYQMAIHAQGDVAIRQALEALATVIIGDNTKKHRIEHNSVVPRDVYSKYGELGIIPVAWGWYPTCNIEGYSNVFGNDSLEFLEDWRALIDANPGLPIAWHSDAPILPLNPFENLYSSITRKQLAADGSVCSPPAWLFENAMTLQEGLEFVTINAANALDRDTEVGSLEKNKFADIVFISGDPLTIASGDLIHLSVLATMADGEFVYCSSDGNTICNAFTSSSEKYQGNIETASTINKPNPFHYKTDILLDLDNAGQVEINVYDIVGRPITKILDQYLNSGEHLISWRPENTISPGIYYYDIRHNHSKIAASKMIYIRRP